MIRTVKTGRTEAAKVEAGAEVRATVEEILADVSDRGDEAVRHYSRTFDDWDPESFRLSDGEIEACVAAVPEQTVEDIRFAQDQIRGFALAQRAAMQDVEVETLPGVVLGLTSALANDLGPHGITVNAVSPGLTRTPGVEADIEAGVVDEDALRAAVATQAIPRPGTPDDLVGLVLFLTGKEASFVTGQFIVADGGATRR